MTLDISDEALQAKNDKVRSAAQRGLLPEGSMAQRWQWARRWVGKGVYSAAQSAEE